MDSFIVVHAEIRSGHHYLDNKYQNECISAILHLWKYVSGLPGCVQDTCNQDKSYIYGNKTDYINDQSKEKIWRFHPHFFKFLRTFSCNLELPFIEVVFFGDSTGKYGLINGKFHGTQVRMKEVENK